MARAFDPEGAPGAVQLLRNALAPTAKANLR